MSGIQAPATRLAVTVVLYAFLLLLLAAITLSLQLPPHKSFSLSGPKFEANTTVKVPTTRAALATARRKSDVVYLNDLYVPGYERAHPELCPDGGAHIRVLILVSSAPRHKSKRSAVRLTWGHYRVRSDIAIAFVIGQTPPSALKAAMIAEDTLYGDLIIGNSIDAYSNLTLKVISMLEWTLQYCSKAQYLLKTDDDMFINVPQLLSHIDKVGKASLTVWGQILYKAKPSRQRTNKCFISQDDWSDPVFPNFVLGSAYLMTADCVRALVTAVHAKLRPYMPLEDVFITGVLTAEVGIQLVFSPYFRHRRIGPRSHACVIKRLIAVHEIIYHKQFEFWRKQHSKTKCANWLG